MEPVAILPFARTSKVESVGELFAITINKPSARGFVVPVIETGVPTSRAVPVSTVTRIVEYVAAP